MVPTELIFLLNLGFVFGLKDLRRESKIGEAMKITAILVLKVPAVQGGELLMLANVSDVSHFGIFQRQAAKEFILFASRTICCWMVDLFRVFFFCC